MRVEVAGENALIIYFSGENASMVSAQVQRMVQLLEERLDGQLLDMVPSYASLLVLFNEQRVDHYAIRRAIRECQTQLEGAQGVAGSLIELPVYYSEESGPDLLNLAANANLTPEQVIDIHSGQDYRVYAIGFAPGFAYLGEVDPRIAAPRMSTPRLKVPKGAVAIADRQTAVYPAVSPGGWNLIGLCPTPMFNPESEPTMPVNVGDRVRFKPVSRDEFLALGGSLELEVD